MTKNKIVLQIFLIFALLLSSSALHAQDSDAAEDPKFVFAVFVNKRSRASLLDKANESNIISYIVNSESKVDLKNKCIKNVRIRQGGKWFRLKKMPLPHVVYDFGIYKGKKDRKRKNQANILKKQLRDHGIPFINPEIAMAAVNNKTLFAKVMDKYKIPHPKTLPEKTDGVDYIHNHMRTNLNKMLDEYDLLYLKPALGSKAYGIIIVTKINEDSFSLKYNILNENKQWVSIHEHNIAKMNVAEAITQARKELRTIKAPYIIQQGINIFRYKDPDNKEHQTDFRINVQRGLNGDLDCTGIMMRVGGNLSQGGRPADYQAVLKALEQRGFLIEAIKDNVFDVAKKTHEALEEFAKRKIKNLQIGDLGMDIIINEDGVPYIVEANNKNGYSTKYVKDNPALENLYGLPPVLDLCEKKDAEHEKNLLDYARYLVNKTYSPSEDKI